WRPSRCSECNQPGHNVVNCPFLPKRPRLERARFKCSLCSSPGHTAWTCPQRPPSKICDECSNLPHRRPPEGCWCCGRPYEPERRVELEPFGQSGIALFEAE